jgi:phosphatidate cytidylyltransferase
MLRQRIVTALVLIPLVCGAVLFLPSIYLGLLFALLALLGAGEWARLSGISSCIAQVPYILVTALSIYGAAWLLRDRADFFWPMAGASLWWLLVAVVLAALRARGPKRHLEGISLLQLTAGLLTLIPAWVALMFLHSAPATGAALVLFLLVLMWVADSGAYFAGRRWGRTKLAPGISPGKTLEGVAGALAGAVLCGVVWAMVQGYRWQESLLFVLLCLLTTLVSVAGDLFESLMKRLRNLKDSGQTLPGHGGVLDRIDSLTAGAPVFVTGLLLMGKAA